MSNTHQYSPYKLLQEAVKNLATYQCHYWSKKSLNSTSSHTLKSTRKEDPAHTPPLKFHVNWFFLRQHRNTNPNTLRTLDLLYCKSKNFRVMKFSLEKFHVEIFS